MRSWQSWKSCRRASQPTRTGSLAPRSCPLQPLSNPARRKLEIACLAQFLRASTILALVQPGDRAKELSQARYFESRDGSDPSGPLPLSNPSPQSPSEDRRPKPPPSPVQLPRGYPGFGARPGSSPRRRCCAADRGPGATLLRRPLMYRMSRSAVPGLSESIGYPPARSSFGSSDSQTAATPSSVPLTCNRTCPTRSDPTT